MEKANRVLTALPHAPGVYLFKDQQGKIIYVGKAIDLSRRVRQYFTRADAVGEKTKLLVAHIDQIETIRTANEFDALLLEAQLIHDWQPHYNVIARDDKSPIYIVLTVDEELPRLLLLRKTNLPKTTRRGPVVFGPFQSATITRSLLRTLRRIVPFCTQKVRNGRGCFYTHLSLCRPCPSVIAKMKAGRARTDLVRQYRRHILRLKAILSGKSKAVLLEMDREMRRLAKQNRFEEASLLKHQIQSLVGLATARFDPSLYLTDLTLVDDIRAQELMALQSILLPYFPNLPKLTRIECIDISHIAGRQSTGSLVVLTNGLVDTSQYRKFRIRRKDAPHDVAMISEVLSRRLNHTEWPLPNLLVVDGGKGQVHGAVTSLSTAGFNIPVLGLAKRFENLVVPTAAGFKTIHLPSTSPAIHVLQRIRDEAHRFAKSYHTLLRTRAFRTV